MKKLINVYVIILILFVASSGNTIYSQNITVNFDYLGGTQSPNGALGGFQYENIPNWITISNTSLGYGYYTTQITCVPNTELARSAVINYKNFDNSINGTYNIQQSKEPCLQVWYLDSDGDGYGNLYSTPVLSCIDPYNGSGVNNNIDYCPSIYSIINNGCEAGYIYENMNWITSKAFDIKGATIASSKSYFDELGKGIQSQSVDIKTGHTWASQTMYDAQGRPALQSLSAPINITGDFLYNPDFIKKSDGITTYTSIDFETTIESPESVGDTPNTLGWYYSESNTNEPYQDITAYPFSRTVYSEFNPGAVRKVIGGNKINGEWKSGYTFSMPASQELSQTVAFNDSKYNTIKTIKTVSRDIHGVEAVMFSDTDGKTLAAARSGGTFQSSSHNINISEQGFVDIHIPLGITGFTMTTPIGIITEVYDLITEQVITTPTANLTNGFYRVAITNLDLYNAVNDPITISYSENYYEFSLNKYNKKGQLIASYQPLNHLESIYDYNVLGRLIYTKSPDEGEAWFKYCKDGQIRFSQNSKQVLEGVFSYTNYDNLGRPIESGVIINNSFATVNPDAILPIGVKKEQHFTVYDSQEIPAGQDVPIKTFNQALADLGLTTEYQPSFLAGNVAVTYTKSPETTTTWYSYDIYGRVDWIVQYINGLGTKTIDYVYDPITSAVTKVDFQHYKADERFIHQYTYNVVGELIKVETSTDNTTFITHADYQYNETGALKRVEIAEGIQGIDYVYNLAGQLKAINHPELTSGKDPNGDINDLFGMQLNYFEGDYLRADKNISSPAEGINQYNGNIKSVTWNTSELGTTNPDSYYYKYNKNNWLEGASFNDPISESSEGINIADFVQTWGYTDFITGSGGGSTVSLTGLNNTITFYYNAGFTNLYIKTGPVVQINYAVPDMDLGYLSVTRSTGEIITNQFKVSISNGWIVINADDPYYHSLQYNAMKSLNNTVTVPSGSTVADEISTTGDYNVFDITYDANGNIQTLNRNKDVLNSNNEMDKLGYTYKTDKPNQLLRVNDNVGIETGADDIKNQIGNPNGVIPYENYIYNEIGQLVENFDDQVKYFYNASGLVTEVQKNNISLVKFFYNDKGQRVRKEAYSDVDGTLIKTEYYVRDAAGSVLAIYNGTTQTELPIYGASRLGVFYKGETSIADKSVYQLTDHLGNVRAVIAKEGNNAIATTATDYYPGGMAMPGRNVVGGYRYNYQGQELDPETGKIAFQLRLYDPRINRWLTVDPLAFKFPSMSGYAAFNNNPIFFVDPDGREPTPAEAARMAAHVYGDKKNSILIGGWAVSKRNFRIKLQDANGLKSQVYQRTTDGVTEYTYATAGTEASWKDVGADAKQPFGLSKQYGSAADNAKSLSKTLGETELTFTGHSLGGGEAALNALVTDRKAVTFNAAGVSAITKFAEGTWKTPFKSESKINAYIMFTDPLNGIQNNSALPDVNGNKHYLTPTDGSSIYNGHSMNNVLKNFGVEKPADYDK